MSITMRECLSQLRIRLDEKGKPGSEWAMEGKWSNDTLRRFMNEGVRDIARRTHFNKQHTTLALTINVGEYAMPASQLSVIQVYYVPGDGRRIPLNPRAYNSLDQIWGSRQNQNVGEPMFYTTYGKSPLLNIRIYPIPAVGSTSLSIYGAILPTDIPIAGGTTDTSTALTLPEAWVDIAIEYAEYQARRIDRDSTWQEVKNLYEQHVDQLMTTQEGNQIFERVVMDTYAGVPSWLWGEDIY